jgi:hypothetical protein
MRADLLGGTAIAGSLLATLATPFGCHLLLDEPTVLQESGSSGAAGGHGGAGAAGLATSSESSSSTGASGGSGGDGGLGGRGGASVGRGGGGGSAGAAGGPSSVSSSGSGGDGGATSSSSSGTGGSGGGPVAIVTGQMRPTRIFVDSQYVFWLNEADDTGQMGSIWRADHDGSNAASQVQGLLNPKGLAGNDLNGAVYFTEDAGGFLTPPAVGVFRVPKSGGAVVALDTGDGLNAGAAVLRSFYVYTDAWAAGTEARVRRSATGASMPAFCYPYVSAAAGGRIAALTVAGSELFSFDTTSGDIMRTTGLDCDPAMNTTVVFAAGQATTRAMTNDSVYVFWLTATAVRRQDQSTPGGNILQLAINQDNPTALTGVTSGIVYTNAGDGSIGAGAVMFTNASQMPVVLAPGQSDPRGVASMPGADDTIFWTNRATGEIMRLDLGP